MTDIKKRGPRGQLESRHATITADPTGFCLVCGSAPSRDARPTILASAFVILGGWAYSDFIRYGRRDPTAKLPGA